MPKPRGATSYRFSDEAQSLLATLAGTLGLSKTATIEMALRKLARSELPAEQIRPESKPVARGRPPKATLPTPPAEDLEATAKKPRGHSRKGK
jgi:hypothetical protein